MVFEIVFISVDFHTLGFQINATSQSNCISRVSILMCHGSQSVAKFGYCSVGLVNSIFQSHHFHHFAIIKLSLSVEK